MPLIRSTLASLCLLITFSPLYANTGSLIDWTESDMATALVQAEKQNKPLFVYWGAVWCPPCNVVKTTIFKDPDFIHATGDYINVYLDGDTEEAQKWGEKLKAKGYPTLMILSPKGKEVLRLSTGQSGSELAQTLNYARNVWHPMTEILSQILSADIINPRSLQAVISYSWDQDEAVSDHPADYSVKLFELEKSLQSPLYRKERSIAFMQALSLKIDAMTENSAFDKDDQQRYLQRVNEILDNPQWRQANLLSLSYGAENLVSKLTSDLDRPGSQRAALIEHFLTSMKTVRQQSGLSSEQFFASLNPAIDFHESFETPFDEDDKKQLIAYTLKSIKNTQDKKARAAMLSDATYTLFKFGLKDDARKITKAALKNAIAPYYLMSMMGYFEKADGNDDKALVWYQKAFQSAQGPATRLQWYGSYIRNLIKLKPGDVQKIKWHVAQLLKDYIRMPDSFWGRNQRVLTAVRKALGKWAKEQGEEVWLHAIQQQGKQQCSNASNETWRAGCEKYYAAFI